MFVFTGDTRARARARLRERERESERETDRERQRQTDRDRETERKKKMEKKRIPFSYLSICMRKRKTDVLPFSRFLFVCYRKLTKCTSDFIDLFFFFFFFFLLFSIVRFRFKVGFWHNSFHVHQCIGTDKLGLCTCSGNTMSLPA